MNLKKPKFWDYKKPSIYAYILFPITLLINFGNSIVKKLSKPDFNKTNNLFCSEQDWIKKISVINKYFPFIIYQKKTAEQIYSTVLNFQRFNY